jgi:hypothetical protein
MVFSLFSSPEAVELATKRISKEDLNTTKKPIEETRECDYEKNCIKLYRAIDEKNFTVALVFLNTGLWSGDFFKDTLSPKDQLKTWVTRFAGTGSERKVAWSQLPIHLAIVQGAPYELIAKMVDMYPLSTRCTDDLLMLPLHLAMRHGSSDRVLECLIRAFPDGVYATGKDDRTPIECAKRGPNKVRAAILEAFIKGDNKKNRKIVTAAHKLEINDFKKALEEERAAVLGLQDKIKHMETKSNQEAKEAREKSRQDIEKIVADYESKISDLDLGKKEVELKLARKSNELAKKNKDLLAAKHAEFGKSATEKEDKAVSHPPSSISAVTKISTQAEKQAGTGKQIPKRRFRGLVFRKTAKPVEMPIPTEKSAEKSIANSVEKKKKQGGDTASKTSELSLSIKLPIQKKTRPAPSIHSPPAHTGGAMSHASSVQDEEETTLSLTNTLFVTADTPLGGCFAGP